jgi:predicted DNA-binding transcriptional regulator AlpA
MLELLDQRIEQRLPARAIRTREVTGLTALSRSTLWRLRRRGQFPTPRRLSDGVMGWLSSDVDQWVRSRPLAVR